MRSLSPVSWAAIAFILLACGALAATLISPPPDPADHPLAPRFTELHLSFEAAKLCGGLEMSPSVANKVGAAIDAEIGGGMGTATRLVLISDARATLAAAGCDSALARDALAQFDAELKPALE
ncbi:hypothetical protein [Oceanibaculum indicum]|uniref:Lipoprotein n=1 Tax=Oceanibaculum indicum P24 TaxID=1207063 RepID=K2JK70_9PROT|nr:hypothetical protein [Oceanibaculum indicum]EKE74852.1 hypothetical protein P24_11902 [Oceanibaculum indicum P24]